MGNPFTGNLLTSELFMGNQFMDSLLEANPFTSNQFTSNLFMGNTWYPCQR